PEVVADEAPSIRARITRAGARVLREATNMLPWLLGVPRELRETTVRADADRAEAGVLVRLKRHVDAEVRPPYVSRNDARVARAGRAAVVERDRDRPARTGGDRGLELIRRDAGPVDVVVDDDRRRPRDAAVGRLRELHVHLPAHRVPVLEREIEVARVGRTRGEAFGDPVTEPRVRQPRGRDGAHGRDRDEW